MVKTKGVWMMIIAPFKHETHLKKVCCPKCKGTNLIRESGIDINTKYRNGKLVENIRMPYETRVHCDDCEEEIDIVEIITKMPGRRIN